MTRVIATLHLRARNQPVGASPPWARITGATYRYGRGLSAPLAALGYEIVMDLDHFYATSGALSERECALQLRQLAESLLKSADAYEASLRGG